MYNCNLVQDRIVIFKAGEGDLTAMNTEPQGIELEEVDVETVAKWLNVGEALLVDVRETSEFELEHIPGAMLVPLSMLDPDTFPRINIKKLVLHCAIGKRSATAAKMLIKAGHIPPINMAGGIKAWREAGLETEIFDEPPTIPEQKPVLSASCIKASNTPPGQILLSEFIKPLGLNQEELASDLGLSISLIAGIVEAECPIDADTAFRLARYFSTNEDFWMQLQMAYDLHQAKDRSGDEIARTVTPRKNKNFVSRITAA
jgi:addiction module HigA family antidote